MSRCFPPDFGELGSREPLVPSWLGAQGGDVLWGSSCVLWDIWALSDIPQVGSRAVPASLSQRGLVCKG